MNILTAFFILLSSLLAGIISNLLQRKIIIYNKETNELVAVVNIKKHSDQILKTNLDIIITDEEVMFVGDNKNGKIYIREEDK